MDAVLQARVETADIADNPQTHVMAVQAFHFAIQRPDKQFHQRADFLRGSIPVFAAESIERQSINTIIRRKRNRAAN
ncbi:hypothetical protein GCM10011513_27540 [Franconibacter daqui]|nr:hypothetical protein GCM10011513_27540 [Franconibacter daqui]